MAYHYFYKFEFLFQQSFLLVLRNQFNSAEKGYSWSFTRRVARHVIYARPGVYRDRHHVGSTGIR